MRKRLLHPFRPSPGEARLLTAGALTGAIGALTAFVAVTQFQARGDLLRVWSGSDIWCAFAGACGAIQGLYMWRRWLGQPGAVGALRAVAGLSLALLTGAVIAGTLILPVYGTMFGPVLAGVTILSHPMLTLGWICGLVLMHLTTRDWRIERQRLMQRMEAWR